MASESVRDGSVYDILYSDTRRLSSLLSQFSDDGLITELARSVEQADGTEAGLSLKVVHAKGSEAAKRGKTERIDPQWLLPLLFLDEAKDIIERDISIASIGSLVLVTGRMVVVDLRAMQKLWSLPNAKKALLAQARKAAQEAAAAAAEQQGSHNRAARRASKQTEVSSDTEFAMELLPLLPHSPQVNIISSQGTAWSTIDPSYFSGDVADLTLKYGVKLPGAWSMVGILDAQPLEERDDGQYDEILTLQERLDLGMYTESLWKVAADLAWPTRQALGRPLFSYGVTPLIIFREIERPGRSRDSEGDSSDGSSLGSHE